MATKKKKLKQPVTDQPESTVPSVHLPRIATLFQSIQRDRVGLELSLERKPDVHDAEALEIHKAMEELENKAVGYLRRECSKSVIYSWLIAQRGIQDRIAGMLIGLIDIERCPTVSALWRYAGQAVVCACGHTEDKHIRHGITIERPIEDLRIRYVASLSWLEEHEAEWELVIPIDHDTFLRDLEKRDPELNPRELTPCSYIEPERTLKTISRTGEEKLRKVAAKACTCQTYEARSERRIKGERLHYNQLLKKTCYLIGRQFLMNVNPTYAPVYRESREYYDTNRPQWSDGRRHSAARRRMVKLFLSHMWVTWRQAAGLTVRLPYAQMIAGHEKGYRPPPVMPKG